MKTLNETFDDEEFEALKKKKKDQSWKNFILSLLEK